MEDYASHIAHHYSGVIQDEGKDRASSQIINLRNFNNFSKSYIIDKYLNIIKENNISEHRIKVLDLCCGKGGDMNKWLYGDVSLVIFVDIAEVSIKQCEERYKILKNKSKNIFKSYFIQADCCQEDLRPLYAKKNVEGIKFDLVSCQFALHYAFETLPRLRQMIANITTNLSKGGFFVGTITDAYKLMNLLKDLPKQDDEKGPYTYKNGVCTIVYDHPSFKVWKNGQSIEDSLPPPPPLLGANYHFTLDQRVDCPEFLAYFSFLEKLMVDNGFQLVYKKNFHKIYQETRNNKDVAELAARMKIYEPYTGSFDAPADSFKCNFEQEYAELIKYLKQSAPESSGNQNPNSNKVGTITKSEWDVIGCYLAFAFRKL